MPHAPRLRTRIHFGPHRMLGPGKVDLLEHIERTGSIAAAGRSMGMSYKRAWMLVETLNAMFRDPVVDSSRGGTKGGGASLTPLGRQIVTLYRQFEQAVASAGGPAAQAIEALLDQDTAQ